MRLRTTPRLRKVTLKINGAIKAQTPIRIDINIQSLEICWGINESDISSLDKVIGDDDVFLIGGHFDVVGADGGLDFVGVVEAFDIIEVADVEGGDVVGGGEG